MIVNDACDYTDILKNTCIFRNSNNFTYIEKICNLTYDYIDVLENIEVLTDYYITHWPVKTILNYEAVL